jgi:DNA-binding NtrC family response regulator
LPPTENFDSQEVESSRQYIRARADGHPFAALLLDGRIPNAPAGKRSSNFFYKQSRRPRVILCNGYAESDLFKEAEQLGFRAFLAKPFSISKFVSF